MSSTDLTLDELDIHFLLKDWLNVSMLQLLDSIIYVVEMFQIIYLRLWFLNPH